jgi:hypothetical protein
MKLRPLFLLLACLSFTAHAQWHTEAVGSHPAQFRTNQKAVQTAKRRTQADTVFFLSTARPFFDDFATALVHPDTETYWMPGGGVFINNTFALGQPSQQVATFDGLKADGTPYKLSPGALGYGDTLTSKWLDFSNYDRSGQLDSVCMSFAFQAGGPMVQFMPELFDSLNLYVRLLGDSVWIPIWNVEGQALPLTGTTTFLDTTIHLPTDWVSQGFQFRFINYGSLNGTGDLFHIDYVYVAGGRDSLNVIGRFPDQAGVRYGQALFYPYTSVPARHVRGLGSLLLRDTLVAEISNLNNFTSTAPITPYNLKLDVTDSATGTLIQSKNQGSDFFTKTGGSYSPRLSPFISPDQFASVGLATSSLSDLRTYFDTRTDTTQTVLNTKFYLENPDPINNPWSANDTLRGYTHLNDYYAYDDGSAEVIRYVGGNNARVAQEFTSYRRDTLQGVQFVFPRSVHTLVPGQTITFNLMVWPKLSPIRNNQPERTLMNLSATYNPSTDRDRACQ